MHKTLPVTAWLVGLAFALLLSAGAVNATGHCRFETWLATTFAASQAFSNGVADPGADDLADSIKRQLGEYSLVEVRRRLRAKGLIGDEKNVAQFIVKQKALLDTFHRRGPEHAAHLAETLAFDTLLGEMRQIVTQLRCQENDDWRAGPILNRLDGMDFAVELRKWAVVAACLVLSGLGVLAITWSQTKRKRRAKRHFCNLACQFSSANQTCQTRIVDVSCLGMKLRLTGRPAQGQPCQIAILGHSISGNVVWSNAEYCGITCHPPLPDDMLEKLLATDAASRKKGGAGIGAALSDPKKQPA